MPSAAEELRGDQASDEVARLPRTRRTSRSFRERRWGGDPGSRSCWPSWG